MSYEDSLNDLRGFVLSKPVFSEGLRHLSPGHEIRILIADRYEAALFYDGQKAVLEARPARKPDVEFSLSPDAVALLKDLPSDNLTDFGIEIVKQIAAGKIKPRVCGSVFNVLTKGYLGVIKEAGPDFLTFLAQHGLTGLGKITSLIKNLKS